MLRKTILPGLAVALVIAACGGSAKTTTNGAAGSSSASAESGIKLADCFRSHGVPNFPDPKSNSGGGVQIQIQSTHPNGGSEQTSVNGVPVNAPAFQSAMNECQKYMPHGGGHGPAGGVAAARKAALAYAACMRKNGVPSFPDPQVTATPGGGIGVKVGIGAGVDPQSPAFKTAQSDCAQVMRAGGLPLAGPPGGSSGSGGSSAGGS
jgi:hypothetical protein